jgi:hypothetical protein
MCPPCSGVADVFLTKESKLKVKQPYVVVLLVRGEDNKTPLTVFPHEVEVLRAAHGEENIHLTDIAPPVKEAEFDTADEFARLEQYYIGDSEHRNPTRSVWRSLEEFEAAFAPADKATLLEEAIALGIPAKANWGVAKLQAAIEEAKAAQ